MTTTQRKAKRKLTNIDFSGETSHIALVHAEQGGCASGANYKLALKNTNFSQEFIEKMQQIRVTLSIPDFLEKFFHLYGSDAEVLARMLGYVPEENDKEDEYDSNWYENYIQEKLDSFEILKSLKESESIANTLATLDEKQYLLMLTDQATLEKALNNKESELVALATESDNSTHASVEKSVEVSTSKSTKSKETLMTKQVENSAEMVEKSLMVTLQKALDDQAVELQKALDTIEAHQKEKQEQIQKSKTAQFTAVIKDEKLQAPIVKAALALEAQEDFDAFLVALTAMQSQIEKQKDFVEKSALFQEQGASTSEEPKDKESAVARILKSKQVK